MAVINKKLLLEAGVHFGHNARRWCPKMKEYVFEERNGIFIIDLKKTEELTEEAYKALYTIAQNGGRVVFVGTRKLIQDVIKEEAVRAGQFYVDQRWLGGTLTNFKTIKRSIARLESIEKMQEDGTFELLPKKEVALLLKEKEKLVKYFSGIREMRELPQAMVVVDPKTEHNAVREARKLNIPIFGLVDTNCDPDEVDYVIPGNDDAVRSVKLIVATLANAVVEANGGTPITIEFPDEPEEKPQRNNNEKRPARKPRNVKPRTEKEEAPKKAEAKQEEVVEEQPAEIHEEVAQVEATEEPKAE